MDAKEIITLFCSFHVYTHIFIFIAAPETQLPLQLALEKYAEHLIMLWKTYSWDSVQEYHFDIHQARILERIDDPQAKKTLDHELKQYLLVSRPSVPQLTSIMKELEQDQIHQQEPV